MAASRRASVRPEVRELRRRRAKIQAGGGETRLARQRERGKMTARERVAALLDAGTFVELDAMVHHRGAGLGMAGVEAPADGVVTGYGEIDGRLAYVFAQDFTVLGGSLGEMHAAKIVKVMGLALQNGAPCIGLYDGGGARIQEGVAALNGFGQIFRLNTMASGVIPQISVIMGPCAGGAVYSPALTDAVVMVEGTAQMFITGPQVIRTVTNEEVTLEALGGAGAHTSQSGVAAFAAVSDQAALDLVRQILAYLPQNHLEDPPVLPSAPPDPQAVAALPDLVPAQPQRPYDVRDVVRAIADGGRFLEWHAAWAPNVFTAFIRLDGHSVAVMANQPRVLAGCLDIDGSDKLARFVRMCDAFHLPLLTLVDTPGYLPGVAQEHGGIIRHGAKVLYAYSEATSAKVSVVLRKAYGGAYLAMCSRSLGADLVFALPTAEIAVMGPEGAVEILDREAIRGASDPERAKAERVAAYRERFANPYVSASLGLVDAVLEPAELREGLVRAFASLAGKRASLPPRKHGNLPV
jgi:acetyl-CoA carboxylase carboxyltransferase component